MKKQNLVTAENQSMFDFGYRVMQGEQEYVTYREGTSFRVWYMTRPDCYARHHHAAVEVVVPHKGECRYIVEGVPYTVKATECLFIPAGKLHSLEMPENSVRNLILFDFECISSLRGFSQIQPLLEDVIYLTEDCPITGEVRRQLFELMHDYHTKPALVNLICFAWLLNIYAYMGSHFLSQQQSAQSVAPRRHEENTWTAINRVAEYVSAHYTEDVSLELVAQIAGFSKFHFSRIFKRYTNATFSQYLASKRLSVAVHLLCTTSLPIVQVALQSGFSSLSTFNRTFKDAHSCTPSEYRALHQREHKTE